MIYNSEIINIYRNLDEKKYDILRGAMNCDLAEVKAALLENPECINQTDAIMGLTALHISTMDMNFSIVDFLCEQPGIDVGIADNLGRTPYLMAIIVGDDRIHERIMRDVRSKVDALDIAEDNALSDRVITFKSRSPSGPQLCFSSWQISAQFFALLHFWVDSF